MTLCEDILLSREERSNLIGKLSSRSDVICVKANVPGGDKLIPAAFLITCHFSDIIYKKWGYKPIILQNADGLSHIFQIDGGIDIKKYTTWLEEDHPLGRLVDIDVTLKGDAHSLTRSTARKCFLCDRPAFVCGRMKAHSVEELLSFFNDKTYGYFSNALSVAIKDSLMGELVIENKFGLVTPTDAGSHKDMDYNLMCRAQDAILPFITQSFFIGLKEGSPKDLLKILRPIGVEAEKAMMSATSNVNCYKGFIFISMILLAAFGYNLKANGDFDGIFSVAREICTDPSVCRPVDTFGFSAYENNFKGVRGEAKEGFPSVKSAAQMLDSSSPEATLPAIVGMIDDTVLLKRSGSVERYHYFKTLISGVDATDREAVKDLTEKCIKENISIGGAADVLICALLINKLKEIFFIK